MATGDETDEKEVWLQTILSEECKQSDAVASSASESLQIVMSRVLEFLSDEDVLPPSTERVALCISGNWTFVI